MTENPQSGSGSVPDGPSAPGTSVPAGSVPTGTGASSPPSGSTTPVPAGPTSAGTTGPGGGAGLSPGEIAVLRKIASDADFRLLFATDPIAAITGAGLQLTTSDYDRLEQLNAAQLEQVATGINVLAGAGTASGLAPEGTNTLVYAIIVALILAVESQERESAV